MVEEETSHPLIEQRAVKVQFQFACPGLKRVKAKQGKKEREREREREREEKLHQAKNINFFFLHLRDPAAAAARALGFVPDKKWPRDGCTPDMPSLY